MRILLDTVTFLWAVSEAAELSDEARELFVDPDNEIYLSSVSTWEIAVKHSLGKLPLPEPPAKFVPLSESTTALMRFHLMKKPRCI
jgi:PIN domain nuclease of toxin-antitoxin system